MQEYRLWKVSYRYDAPSDKADGACREQFLVVGKDEGEAKDKAYELFTAPPRTKRNFPYAKDAICSVRPYDVAVRMPMLSSDEDRRAFDLSVRIAEKGTRQTLEFIIKKRSE